MHTLIFGIALVGTGALAGATWLRATPQPEPAPSDDEKSPDYCFTHKQVEPKDER